MHAAQGGQRVSDDEGGGAVREGAAVDPHPLHHVAALRGGEGGRRRGSSAGWQVRFCETSSIAFFGVDSKRDRACLYQFEDEVSLVGFIEDEEELHTVRVIYLFDKIVLRSDIEPLHSNTAVKIC